MHTAGGIPIAKGNYSKIVTIFQVHALLSCALYRMHLLSLATCILYILCLIRSLTSYCVTVCSMVLCIQN